MKKHKLLPWVMTLIGVNVVAQEINPVWVQHLNGLINVSEADRLPILKKQGDTADKADGNSTVEVYVGFIKYSDSLYLLGVRENGIDETSASLTEEERARALAYPDRSILWIDAQTGRSRGVALKTEIFPVPLATQAPTHFWWSWGITDGPHGERVIYTGYKYKILRYAATGINDQGFATWSTTPTEAWVEPVPGEPNPTILPGEQGTEPGLSEGDGSNSWRQKSFRVWGHGSNVVVWAGGGTWRMSMHSQEFVSDNGGLTLRPVARLNDRGDGGGSKGFYTLGGEPSKIVSTPTDTNRPNLKVTYQAHFPGSGWDARPFRYTRNPDAQLPDGTANARTNRYDPDGNASGNLLAFTWEAAGKDGVCVDHNINGVSQYDGNWVMTLDTDDGLDYVVTYSIPSWNNVFGAIKKPGWLGVHTLDGKVAVGSKNAYQLPFYETDEPVAANGATGSTYGYEGDVEVYSEANGNALVLASFGQYGFGVFRVTARVAPTGALTAPANVSTSENQPVNLSARFTGSGTPLFYWWQKDDGSGTFVNVPGATGNLGILGVNSGLAALSFNRIQTSDAGRYRVVVGNSAGTVASAVATVAVSGDSSPPLPVAASTLNPGTIDLRFSEPLDTNSPTLLDNFTYLVTREGVESTAASVAVLGDARTVRLSGFDFPITGAFSVRVQPVPDLKGNVGASPTTVAGAAQDFLSADIGGASGLSVSPIPGEIEMFAGGGDFWGNSDSGQIVYQTLSGDFDVKVQIKSNQRPSNRNGIMVRESLNADSAMVTATWNPDAKYGFFSRATTGANVDWAGTPRNWVCDNTPPPNVWLRLSRSGNTYTGYYSADGEAWISLGSSTVDAIPGTALVGLAANRGGLGLSGGTVFAGYGSVRSLRIVRDESGAVVLSWLGGGVLEAATNITGPWSSEGLSQSNPQTLTPAGGQVFYRLR